MSLTAVDWHRRYLQQALWTQELRAYLLGQIHLPPAPRVLEVGCGTGAVLTGLPGTHPAGLDRDLSALRLAQEFARHPLLTAGDALRLPFAGSAFDACFTHFFFLWVSSPAAALSEMVRATRPGGWIVALAEPVYGGRIDHPAELAALGQLQGAALRAQGADPYMGRKLSGLFHAAGLQQVHTGLLGGQWSTPPGAQAWESEWAVLQADLGGRIAPEELNNLRRLDAAAWEKGERILFVPTFYAWGQVPS